MEGPGPEDILEFLAGRASSPRERWDVRESGDYIVIVQVTNTRKSYRDFMIYRFPPFFFNMAELKRLKPHKFKLRSIVALHKHYKSVEAACSLYSWRTRLRMNCVGRPEAVEELMSMFLPHTIALPYNPAGRIRYCDSATIISYPLTMKTDVYLCTNIKYNTV